MLHSIFRACLLPPHRFQLDDGRVSGLQLTVQTTTKVPTELAVITWGETGGLALSFRNDAVGRDDVITLLSVKVTNNQIILTRSLSGFYLIVLVLRP